jgi:hypothetical protein
MTRATSHYFAEPRAAFQFQRLATDRTCPTVKTRS